VPPERRPAHVQGCRLAAAAGLEVLLSGGSSLDATVRAVEIMESDPKFNAGTGSSLTDAGTLEMDAAVMEGSSLRAGAVCALPPFEHPIRIALAALEDERHILYAGQGACDFARAHGFSPAAPEQMITERARARLRARLSGRTGEGWAGGTVGAVACDAAGRVAAATSTGGTVGKAPGRVGDTAILGAGTFADDEGGACSATGIGESIMRACVAKAAVDAMRAGLGAQDAARAAMQELRRVEGSGGIILVDRAGGTAFARNTDTMSQAVAKAGAEIEAGS